MIIEISNISISVERNQDKAIIQALERSGIKKSNIKKIEYIKRSIDSRKRNDIKFIYNLSVELNNKINISKIKNCREAKAKEEAKRKSKNLEGKIAVIGTGPSGLFAALSLVEYGYEPLIFERGEDVDNRDKSVNQLYEHDNLNTNSNIQFGEGGAGTYSDGKLTTRVRSGYMNKIFLELVENGAQEEILYHYKPHVGTDILKEVVKNLREKIKKAGGKFYFNSQVTDMKVINGRIKELEINKNEKIEVEHVLLGIGHSARDTYKMLHKHGVFMENKDFAVGARIENPREDIDRMQYGKFAGHPNLGAATYNYVYNNRDENRGVFSFCMCPGGEIVNATSENGMSLVNGMSYSGRDGKFSNSALVVAVREEDYGNELFAGLKFQEELEKKTYEIIRNYGGLYQSVFDYMKNVKTNREIESSYGMRLHSHNLNNLFPDVINRNMHKAFNYWSRNRNFISERANLIAPETRTSAPIRITRDQEGRSLNIFNLYPIGEGAGYAGGIVSAAIDGLKIVDNIFTEIYE